MMGHGFVIFQHKWLGKYYGDEKMQWQSPVVHSTTHHHQLFSVFWLCQGIMTWCIKIWKYENKLITFSFENFKITRRSTGKTYVSIISFTKQSNLLHWPKKFLTSLFFFFYSLTKEGLFCKLLCFQWLTIRVSIQERLMYQFDPYRALQLITKQKNLLHWPKKVSNQSSKFRLEKQSINMWPLSMLIKHELLNHGENFAS